MFDRRRNIRRKLYQGIEDYEIENYETSALSEEAETKTTCDTITTTNLHDSISNDSNVWVDKEENMIDAIEISTPVEKLRHDGSNASK